MNHKMWAQWKDFRLDEDYEEPDVMEQLFEVLQEQGYVPGSIKTPSSFKPGSVKNGKYDAMDIIRAIKSGGRRAGDTSAGVPEMLNVLWSKVEKRFRKYLGGKKRR